MNSRTCELADGRRIHYLETGLGHTNVLLLLHGYPGNALLWRHIMPVLGDGYRVVAPDLPGHGKSAKPRGARYAIAYFIDFLEKFISAMELGAVGLVGHDIGAVTALGFAADNPNALAGLAVLNTAPYAEWSRPLQSVVRRIRHPVFGRLLLVRPVFHRALKGLLFYRPERVSAETLERYRRPWIESAAGRRAFRKIVDVSMADASLTPDRLRRIRTRTLILWGDRDPMMGISVANRLEQDILDAELELIPEAGHFLQEDNPLLIGRRLLSFFINDGGKDDG